MTDKAYMAKKFLQDFRKLEKEITARQETILHILDAATRSTPSLEAERVSGTAEHSRLEAAMVQKIDLERRMDEKIAELREKREDIVNAVDAIGDPTERSMLLYRYVQGRSWPYVMAKLEITERTSYRIHESALLHFGEIFF